MKSSGFSIREESGRFGPIERRVHPWRSHYDPDSYVKLIATHSDHIRLSDDRRRPLLAAVRRATEPYGGVEATTAAVLLFAQVL